MQHVHLNVNWITLIDWSVRGLCLMKPKHDEKLKMTFMATFCLFRYLNNHVYKLTFFVHV